MTDTQKDYRDMVSDAKAEASKAERLASAAEQMVQKGAVAWMIDVDIVHESAVSLSLAPRDKAFPVAQAVFGDRVYVHRREEPTLTGVATVGGIIVEGTGFVPQAGGSVKIYYVIPAVGLGQKLVIPLRLVGYRPAVLAS
jgi:hypothetical protein